MNFPKFICIGSQRAGTTWLYECLKEHPEVYVPLTKELHFFDRFYSEGVESYSSNFPIDEIDKVKTWGEITPNYYQVPCALERIHKLLPEVKIIYILREPVSRAYSQYQLFVQNDFKGESFEEVLEKHSSVIDLSLQGKHLEKLYTIFPRKNVLVLFYDELLGDPEAFIKKVFVFLGVNASFVPKILSKKINKVAWPKLQSWLNKIGFSWVIELVKKTPFAGFFQRVGQPKAKKADMVVMQNELKNIFKSDVEKIERMTGVSLKQWM